MLRPQLRWQFYHWLILYLWSEYCECALMQKYWWILNYLHFWICPTKWTYLAILKLKTKWTFRFIRLQHEKHLYETWQCFLPKLRKIQSAFQWQFYFSPSIKPLRRGDKEGLILLSQRLKPSSLNLLHPSQTLARCMFFLSFYSKKTSTSNMKCSLF